MGTDGGMPDVRSLRIPLKYLANLLTAGDELPVARGLERMLAMRAYMRAKTVDGVIDETIAQKVGLTGQQIEDMVALTLQRLIGAGLGLDDQPSAGAGHLTLERGVDLADGGLGHRARLTR